MAYSVYVFNLNIPAKVDIQPNRLGKFDGSFLYFPYSWMKH